MVQQWQTETEKKQRDGVEVMNDCGSLWKEEQHRGGSGGWCLLWCEEGCRVVAWTIPIGRREIDEQQAEGEGREKEQRR